MHRSAAGLVSTFLLLVGHGVAEGQAHFTVKLSGSQQVPAVATAAAGTGWLTLTSAGVQFMVTAEGLSGPITAAHIHNGAPGTNGGVVRVLTSSLSGNTASGLWQASDSAGPLTPALIDQLLQGNLYVNYHTAANPAGEVRGQIVLSGGSDFTANLTGAQENPATAASGTGTGAFTLTEEGLLYKITGAGLTGPITAAHIHTGTIGVSGPVLADITPGFVGTTATGTVALTAAQRRDLLAGNLYTNVHTSTNPGGEIRGQIVLGGGFGFSATLTGAQQVPAVATTATATASLTLTPAGLQVDLTATGLSGAITAAHIHNAASGVNGVVVRTLTGDFFTATSASALWRYDDAQPLTPALVAELLAGRLYINLHTAANPGGEIRGQMNLNHPSATPTATFTARLNADQERPATGAAARGTGTFRLTPAGLAFDVTVDGLTGPITAAHFHNAAIGVNGGVVRAFTTDFTGNTAAGVWAPTDAAPLTAALITELLDGRIYVNVHTSANPGGEMRGQVLLSSGADLDNRLSGAQENPPLAVAGLGTGTFTLTPSGLAFSVTVDGLSGAITAAHFHSGAPGTNGGVVRTITTNFTGTTARGVWKPSDAEPLTAALVTELLKGNLYVNVHTSANPGGEIRGQVQLVGDHRGAALTGAAEVPPVATPGIGVAATTLTDMGLAFRVSATDLSGALTAAHFHDAPAGVNGGVVRTITGEFVNLMGQGVWAPTDAEPLTTALLGDLVTDRIYLNLHTMANPGGEIRGQSGSRNVAGVGGGTTTGSGTLRLANAPNPVPGRTTFSFYVPRRSSVSLQVFDLRGAAVATVVSGMREAGWQHVAFDAHGLESGVYFYRLETGALRETRKMLVLR